METGNNLIENIRYLAKEKNIQVGDLELGAGVARGYFSRVAKANNPMRITLGVACYTADTLGVPLQDLLERKFWLEHEIRRLENELNETTISLTGKIKQLKEELYNE